MANEGYLEGNNRPFWNFVFHRAATDDERGIPALGKIVYRIDLGYAELCVDTDPDPDLPGGGTWVPVGGGEVFADWTPTLDQDGALGINVLYAYIASNSVMARGGIALQVTSGPGSTPFPVELGGFPIGVKTGYTGGGHWFGDIGGTRLDGWISPGTISGDTITGFGLIGSTASLGAAEALDDGDSLVIEFHYPI